MLEVEGYVRKQIGSLARIGDTLYDVITGKTVLTDISGSVATGNSWYIWDDETETYTRNIAEFKS